MPTRAMPTLLLLVLCAPLQAEPADWRRPVATYSIVARDSSTGELGVAVQSHWFSVGPIVPWARAGIGAVATQSLVNPAYGPLRTGADGVWTQRVASPDSTACGRCGS